MSRKILKNLENLYSTLRCEIKACSSSDVMKLLRSGDNPRWRSAHGFQFKLGPALQCFLVLIKFTESSKANEFVQLFANNLQIEFSPPPGETGSTEIASQRGFIPRSPFKKKSCVCIKLHSNQNYQKNLTKYVYCILYFFAGYEVNNLNTNDL